MTDEIVALYRPGSFTGRELQQAIDQVQADLASDSDALADLGITADELSAVRFTVEEEAGFDPGTILIAILIGVVSKLGADATTAVAKKAWPAMVSKLRGPKYGADALGDEQTLRPDEPGNGE